MTCIYHAIVIVTYLDNAAYAKTPTATLSRESAANLFTASSISNCAGIKRGIIPSYFHCCTVVSFYPPLVCRQYNYIFSLFLSTHVKCVLLTTTFPVVWVLYVEPVSASISKAFSNFSNLVVVTKIVQTSRRPSTRAALIIRQKERRTGRQK